MSLSSLIKNFHGNQTITFRFVSTRVVHVPEIIDCIYRIEKRTKGSGKKRRKERDWKIGGGKWKGRGFVLLNTLPFHPPNWITYLSRIAASRCSADKGNTSSSGISERRPTRPTLIERDARGYPAPSSSTDPAHPFPASNGARFSICVWKLLVNAPLVHRFPASPKKIFTDNNNFYLPRQYSYFDFDRFSKKVRKREDACST